MTNKEVVAAMYEEFFNGHNVDSAQKYVKDDYKQHNPGVGQGRQALMDAFGEKFKQEPTFKLDVKMLIEDRETNMVAVYLKNVDPSGTTRARVVDIYRLEDGKLAEHWDVLQTYV